MHRILLKLLLPLALLLNFQLHAQKYVMIKGQVWDLSGQKLVGAHAYNSTRHYGTFTDIEGLFFLVMNPGDSLRITMVGYKPYRMRIPAALSADNYKLDVTLLADTIMLKTAEIKPYPLTYAELKREFTRLKLPEAYIRERWMIPNINYGSKYTNPNGGGILLPGPFSLLYNTFSKEAKELRKMNKILEHDKLRDEFLKVIPRDMLAQRFGIKSDDQIDELMTRCGITLEFLRSRSGYDVINHVVWCSK